MVRSPGFGNRGRGAGRAGARAGSLKHHSARRALHIESLEERRVLAGGPTLAGISVNDGTLLVNGDVRAISPSSLTFSFDNGQVLDASSLPGGITVTRSGFDGVFGNADDVAIQPGFLGLGENSNQVIMRFASALPDDGYRIRLVGTGETPLKNTIGQPFNMGTDVTVGFELNLAPQVIAVVPQPIVRNPSTRVLSQARDQIVVYFNNDDLAPGLATNPAFYQLIFTGHTNEYDPAFDTVTNTDDGAPIRPISVAYSAVTDTAILTFADDLHDLGVGSFRLRIGTSETPPAPPVTSSTALDPGSSFSTADTSIGTLTTESLVIASAIEPQPSPIILPGSNQDPGHRQVSSSFDQHVPEGGADALNGVSVIAYNFKSIYGRDTNNVALRNLINETQKLRAREAFSLWGHYLGVQFVETPSDGFTIATGDLRALDPTAITDPDVIQGASGDIPGAEFGPTAVLNGAQRWTEEYGGTWFREAMRQIGFLLGLGAAGDLPEGTIMGGNPELTFGNAPLGIFPGDHDITHGRYLYRPDGNDIDLYRFTMPEAGLFNAETVAERLPNSSLLDTVLRLYRQQQGTSNFELVAQNDDYYSQDSFLSLNLQPGTYFLGVSSKGNDQYNPVVANSGAGGTTEGNYQLRVELRTAVSDALQDATGIPLDGDGDGLPGGVHNHWFRVQTPDNVLIVDKTAAAGGNGTLAAPFPTIVAAMNAAAAGDVVRVVGNNLGDASTTNEVPYQIGFDSFGNALPDGGSNGILDVKAGVTLVFDAGTVVKMRRGAIVVGSTSPVTDRSGAAIQVLGTPGSRVVFTSVNDDTIGTDINPLNVVPRPGDWGGLLIRSDFDHSAGRFDYEDQGIFLNHINHAEMRYGGGVLSINSVSGVVNPITMIDARPTVTFNTITSSADAAMAASPNAFVESNFNDPQFQAVPFTADYNRVGPDIHGNHLSGNTTNGIFVANPFSTSPRGDALTTSARWDDEDIVHVVAVGLRIAGTPGGPTGADVFNRVARQDARLRIDPGTVVKLEGAQIEVGAGATFLAEGTSDRPIVFTSLLDDRYGIGGTFDTNSDGSASRAGQGDWAGIYLGPTSQGSFDYNVIAHGGGVAPIEGSFTGFNAIEVHQADTRITHSRFESNASGVDGQAPATRFGRTQNGRGTIFVAGAQPVIVDNVFVNNASAVIYIDVNSLNYENIVDAGRSTGPLDRIPGFGNNQGPLVRNNRFTGNGLNGMEVRGGTLTTQSIWDDTDIVHVLKSGVYIPNFHTFGGLQLKSSVDRSLVVKLQGKDAGFITTGSSVGVLDHIGGTLQVIGQPGQPVVMTSLFDDTVGAGFDTQGFTQTDTNNGGRPYSGSVEDRFQIDINFGPRISLIPELKDAVRKAADEWEEEFSDPITIIVDVEIADLGGGILAGLDIDNSTRLFDTTADRASIDFNAVRSAMINDAGKHESILNELPTYGELNFVIPDLSTTEFDVAPNMELTRANAKALRISTASGNQSAFDPLEIRDGRIDINSNVSIFDLDRKNGLATYREDFISQFQRELGEVMGFISGVDTVNAGLSLGFTTDVEISPLDLFRFAPGQAETNFRTAPRMLDPRQEAHVFYAGANPDFDYRDFPLTGLRLGEIPLATGLRRGDELNDNYGAAFWRDDVFFRSGTLTVLDTIGVMDPRSRLRDEVLYELDPNQTTEGLIHDITEADRTAFDAIGYNVVGGTPGDWLGIRVERLSHDGNVAVVPENETPSSPPATNATPATAQFLGQLAPNEKSGDENIRLGFEVQGLINQPADVDVYSFRAVAGTPVWLDLDRTGSSLDSVLELISADGVILARSNNSLAEADDPSLLVGIGQPFANRDIYTSNVLDAGMQLVLPGTVGVQGTYNIRVRSASNDLSNLAGGRTEGNYQLQVRLQAEDEVPGVSVKLADIRFAETGVHIIGPPTRSPLGGEQTENYRLNDAFIEQEPLLVDDMGMPADDPPQFVNNLQLPNTVKPQFVGNVLNSRQGAVSVFGKLITDADVDWYRFQVSYDDLIPSFATSQFQRDRAGLVFDIDYADGLGRPDTTLGVYDSLGRLLFYSDTSNVAGDQPASGSDPAAFDLSRGSFGVEDPFIGPVVVDAARDLTAADDLFGQFFFAQGTYYVAVSSGRQVPQIVADGSAPLTPILGLAGRGFEVSGAGFGNTLYAPDPSAPIGGTYTGEYQLEIRSVTIPEGGFNSATSTLGDSNRKREQGQITVSSNQIRSSRNWGIAVEDGLRDFPVYLGDVTEELFGNAVESQSQQNVRSQPHTQFSPGDYIPYQGAARALPNLNEERLIPGLTLENNLVAGGREGGIQLAGDPAGVVLNTYSFNTFNEDMQVFNIDNQKFTLWDHQRKSITFSFNAINPGELEMRANTDPNDDNGAHPTTFVSTSGAPTLARLVADEIEHAIRLSDLDVKVYRGDFDSLFVEGVVEIGQPDVVGPDAIWSVFRNDKPSDDVPGGRFGGGFGDPRTTITYGQITAEMVQQGAVPYARVVNNTLFGRGGSLLDPLAKNGVGDIGISVEDNSSPTLLNNIISNFAIGIQADPTSTDQNIQRRTFIGSGTIDQSEFEGLPVVRERFTDTDVGLAGRLPLGASGLAPVTDEFVLTNRYFLDYDSFPTDYVGLRPTVIGGSVYQGNARNTDRVGLGDFALVLANSDPLFVDPAAGNFFLEANSKAIDSSIDQLAERTSVLEVMNAVGIDSEGISAPSTDVQGILRVDDPSVEPPAGFGRNVFKDRGALERADFIGPVAQLVKPVDNDASDRDPTNNVVAVFGEAFTSFQIRFSDSARLSDPVAGSGADPNTVTADAVSIFRGGTELVIDTDYVLTYDATNSTIRLTPTAGVWPSGTYRIVLDNAIIRDRADNPLQANLPSGTTEFTLTVGEGFDFGDAPDSYGTLLASDGARHRFIPTIFLGAGLDPEADASVPPAPEDALDDGFDLPAQLFPGTQLNLQAVVSQNGFINGWIDFNGNGSFADANEQILVNRGVVTGSNAVGPIVIPDTASFGNTWARFRFSTASGLGPTGEAPDGEVEDYPIKIGDSVWQNPTSPLDVNNDGNQPTPLDALTVINELSVPVFSNPDTGRLPDLRQPGNPYLDVNGDGYASPIDALLVINELPSTSSRSANGQVVVATPEDERDASEVWAVDAVFADVLGGDAAGW